MSRTRTSALVGIALPWLWFVVRDLSFLGPVAIMLPVLAAVGVVLAVAASRRDPLWLLAACSVAVVAATSVLGPWRAIGGEAPVAPIRILFANLLLENEHPDLARALASHDADIVITTETNGHQYTALVEMLGTPRVVGGDDAGCSVDPGECSTLNVWTRLPVDVSEPSAALEAARGVRFTVEAGDASLTIAAVHPPSPSPFFWRPGNTTPWGHAGVVSSLREDIGDRPWRTVLVGDLNLSDRQTEYRSMLEQWKDAVRIGGAAGTTGLGIYRPLFLRIDHVFISPDLCAERTSRIDLPGSDHRGLVSSVGVCPPG